MSRKSGRSGHRPGPRQRRPNTSVTPLREHRDGNPDLIRTLRHALRSDEPLDLLSVISGLMEVAGTRRTLPDEALDLPSLDMLVDTFIDAPYAETTAALHVIRALTPDPVLASRIGAAVTERRHPLPAWLLGLATACPSPEVWLLNDVLGDGDDYFIGIEFDGDHALTCVVYVDHNLGTVVKDAFVLPLPVADVLATARSSIDDASQTIHSFDPATARAIIERAEQDGDHFDPPLESETWPMCRPLVDWMVRMLPEGGSAPERRDWTDDELEEVVDGFLESPYGAGFDTLGHVDLLDAAVVFAANEGPADPLRWSSVSVELLMVHWFPHVVGLPLDTMRMLPDTLRQFIRYSHDLQEVSTSQRAETLASVDRWEPAYIAQIEANAAAGLYDGVSPRDHSAVVLAALDRVVGSREKLLALDTAALPDEAFDWAGVPDDLHDVVAAMLSDCDRVAEELLTVEHRTAMRRLLHRLAVHGPAPLRRKASTSRSAAAIAWLIHCANDRAGLDDSYHQLPSTTLLAAFGVSSVNDRASTFVKALGLPPVYSAYEVELDSADYLTSTTRSAIIMLRDLMLEP